MGPDFLWGMNSVLKSTEQSDLRILFEYCHKLPQYVDIFLCAIPYHIFFSLGKPELSPLKFLCNSPSKKVSFKCCVPHQFLLRRKQNPGPPKPGHESIQCGLPNLEAIADLLKLKNGEECTVHTKPCFKLLFLLIGGRQVELPYHWLDVSGSLYPFLGPHPADVYYHAQCVLVYDVCRILLIFHYSCFLLVCCQESLNDFYFSACHENGY